MNYKKVFLMTYFVMFLIFLQFDVLADIEYGKIEIIRDQWGIPNVFSDTDLGAMYGLGYATAEDRCFQMYYMLRIAQGRLAETIGNVKTIDGGDSALNSDRKMRIFGFYRSAQIAQKSLEPETLALLQAYSDGVNRYIKDNADKMHYLFGKYKLSPEPWTPADCIASWWKFGNWFASDGLGDKISVDFKKADSQEANPIVDDDSAVVKRDDITDEWMAEINQYIEKHGLKKHQGSYTNPPKFSHAWVIGGSKTTTGSAVLVSDPQTPVWNPSLLYEFHISGKTFNTRGIGVAGSPIILIGFNENVAWGMSALGGDQADLFLLKTDPLHPNQYKYDGKWKDIRVFEETIKVKNGNDEKITIKETHHGPVVNDLINNPPNERQIASKRFPMCDTESDAYKSALGMIRAKDAFELSSALANWHFPTANCIFGDGKGNIGYRAIGAYPVRSAKSIQWGDYAQDGSSSEWEWQEMIPANLLPQVMNPKEGYLVSANHRVIQSFYELPLGHSTGAFGETNRGLRIKEKIKEHLKNSDKFTPDDVLAVQYDAVSISKRTVIQLGFHIRDILKGELSQSSLNALKYLEDWYKNGAQSNTLINGTELVNNMQIIFRAGYFPLAKTYGGGAAGMANFSKAISNRLTENPNASLSSEEINFADTVLKNAWDTTINSYGSDTGKWHEKAIESMQEEKLRYYQSLEGFPSLDEEYDINYPTLRVTDGETIWSQRSQAYTQYVPLHNTDLSKTILPIGPSERPDSPYRFSTYGDWCNGFLHDAPLSREKVEKIKTRHISLSMSDNKRQQFVIEDANGNEILPGCAPMDETLREKGIRKIIQKNCPPEEVDRIIKMLLGYVKGNKSLTDELIGSFQRMIYVEYGNDYARQRMGETIRAFGAELPPQRPEKFKKKFGENKIDVKNMKTIPDSNQSYMYQDLPDISTFIYKKSDRFIVDMDDITGGNPFKGVNSRQPHTGAHINFNNKDNRWSKDNDKPENYPPIYAVSDGFITRIDESFTQRTGNDRYGVAIAFAKDDKGDIYQLCYSIEPMIPEPSKSFYSKFIKVVQEQKVHKGDIIAYMYIPPSIEHVHIHLHIQRMHQNGFMAPAVFTQEVVDQFHARWKEWGKDGDIQMPSCMGYMLGSHENPFGTGAADKL